MGNKKLIVVLVIPLVLWILSSAYGNLDFIPHIACNGECKDKIHLFLTYLSIVIQIFLLFVAIVKLRDIDRDLKNKNRINFYLANRETEFFKRLKKTTMISVHVHPRR